MHRRKFVCSLIPLLASCGGGGSDIGAASHTPAGLSATQAEFTGTLLSNGAPVPGAEVFLPVNVGKYSTRTDADGKYNLVVPISDFAGMTILALRAYKDGYQPFIATYQGPLTGATSYTLSAGSNSMTQLAPNEYSSLSFSQLYHLGDDSFGGSANSQLQTRSQGLSAGISVFNWNTADNGKFRSARVSFLVRGLQGRTGSSAVKGLAGLTDSTARQLGNSAVLEMDSDPNGGYSRLQFEFVLPSTIPAGGIKFNIQTGRSTSGDYDDIEFTGLSIQLV